MANKTLFQTIFGGLIPATDTVNSERAPAYALSPKQALAQYAATGCFNRTFYAAADEQLQRVLELCDAVGPEFVAQVAVYSRRNAYMKDMPALLCAWLAARSPQLAREGVRAGDRQRQDAAHVRADPAFGRGWA